MNSDVGTRLGRRERQIVEILYRLGKASVAEVLAELPDPPSYSAVRGMLTLLEGKGYVRHKRDGLRYVYTQAVASDKARQSALRQPFCPHFCGVAHRSAAALLEMSGEKLSAEGKGPSALIARREKEGQ